jgi:hypothetical protein
VLPVVGMNPAASTSSSTPTAASTFRLLGGSDSASPRAVSIGLVSSRTEWPRRASMRPRHDPDGPPPMITASNVVIASFGHLVIWSFGH